MTMIRRLGLLGGTFDPVHTGHLAAASAAQRALGLDEVWLLTSHVPPHRSQPAASVHHRFAMVALAVQECPELRASDFELASPGPSYTAATLERLHAGSFRPSQLFFILGADAFAEIATWRDYPRFMDGAHFVVVSRGDQAPPRHHPALTAVASRLREAPSAGVVEPDSPLSVFLVESPTPDTSSTDIRRRLAQGLTIAGLVPAAVEHHIRRHGLYAPGRGTPVEGVTAGLLLEQEHF